MLVKITAASAGFENMFDVSDNLFGTEAFGLVLPNGTEILRSGATYLIQWDGGASTPNDLILEYSTDSGDTWGAPDIATGQNGQGGRADVDPGTISGVVGTWLLNETSGTNAPDTVGSNNGTLSGGSEFTTSGKFDEGVIFDGSDGPYSEGDSPNPVNIYGKSIFLFWNNAFVL